MGHLLMENQNGLIVVPTATHATGTAEREAAEAMVAEVAGSRRITLGGDKNYDTQDFVLTLRDLKVTTHVAANTERKGGSAIDSRTTRHSGYAVSQKFRKRIEDAFGWMKTVRQPPKDQVPRSTESPLALHLHRCGLQPCQNEESGVAAT